MTFFVVLSVRKMVGDMLTSLTDLLDFNSVNILHKCILFFPEVDNAIVHPHLSLWQPLSYV